MQAEQVPVTVETAAEPAPVITTSSKRRRGQPLPAADEPPSVPTLVPAQVAASAELHPALDDASSKRALRGSKRAREVEPAAISSEVPLALRRPRRGGAAAAAAASSAIGSTSVETEAAQLLAVAPAKKMAEAEASRASDSTTEASAWKRVRSRRFDEFFYFNVDTGEAVWEKPQGLDDVDLYNSGSDILSPPARSSASMQSEDETQSSIATVMTSMSANVASVASKASKASGITSTLSTVIEAGIGFFLSKSAIASKDQAAAPIESMSRDVGSSPAPEPQLSVPPPQQVASPPAPPALSADPAAQKPLNSAMEVARFLWSNGGRRKTPSPPPPPAPTAVGLRRRALADSAFDALVSDVNPRSSVSENTAHASLSVDSVLHQPTAAVSNTQVATAVLKASPAPLYEQSHWAGHASRLGLAPYNAAPRHLQPATAALSLSSLGSSASQVYSSAAVAPPLIPIAASSLPYLRRRSLPSFVPSAVSSQPAGANSASSFFGGGSSIARQASAIGPPAVPRVAHVEPLPPSDAAVGDAVADAILRTLGCLPDDDAEQDTIAQVSEAAPPPRYVPAAPLVSLQQPLQLAAVASVPPPAPPSPLPPAPPIASNAAPATSTPASQNPSVFFVAVEPVKMTAEPTPQITVATPSFTFSFPPVPASSRIPAHLSRISHEVSSSTAPYALLT
jgi:hypothetical protein